MIIFRLLAAVSVFAFLCIGCSGDRLAGGTGEETTNGRLAGIVVNPGGTPAPRSQVTLIPDRYDPIKDAAALPLDTTDDSGEYVFTGVPYGTYTVRSIQCVERTRAIAFGVTVGKAGSFKALLILQRPGSLKVALSGNAQAANGYVYVPGSDMAVMVNGSGGYAFIDSVPAGNIPAVNYGAKGDTATSVIRYDVPVVPGDTARILNPSWRHARRLTLNTTSSGAGVPGNVLDFPALLRLTGNKFNFSEAQATGDDLRFTKADNTPLPFEIERWDPVAGLAEAWVKLDTVYGNDNSHFIIMYWDASTGSPQGSGNLAATVSNSAAVFDTGLSGGWFQGVWHLNDPAGAPIKDATFNLYNGVRSNMTGPGVAGIIGIGRDFRGDSSYIIMPGTAASKLNFQENGVYALCAWVYADTLDSAYHTILSKGDQQYNLEILDNSWEFAQYKDKQGWEMSQSPLPAAQKQWVHVAGVRDGARQYLYVNGQCVDSGFTTLGNNFNRYAGYDLMIGKTNGATMPGFPYYFHGILDEVRIHNCALSADWIKVCYMNQKQPDALIVW